MRRRLLALPPLLALAGCAGYAADYWRPKVGIISPQLSRYGLNQAQAQCAGRRLGGSLSVRQLRQLERIARLVPQGHFGRSALEPRDLVAVASHVEDRRVRPEVAAAIGACAPARTAVFAAPPSAEAAVAAAQTAPLWLNLGAAPTGQAISVNASSIVEQPGYRQAWFRLTDPGASGPSPGTYLLRVDCAARTINSMGFRRFGPSGQVVDQIDYGPAGEGAGPIVGGTVMEIAYLALCT